MLLFLQRYTVDLLLVTTDTIVCILHTHSNLSNVLSAGCCRKPLQFLLLIKKPRWATSRMISLWRLDLICRLSRYSKLTSPLPQASLSWSNVDKLCTLRIKVHITDWIHLDIIEKKDASYVFRSWHIQIYSKVSK